MDVNPGFTTRRLLHARCLLILVSGGQLDVLVVDRANHVVVER